MADAAGAQPDEHLALRWRRQIELRQLERSTHPLEDRGANLQGPFSPAAAAPRGLEVSWLRFGGAVFWSSRSSSTE